MTELVQLERRHQDFAKRNAEVVVVSVEAIDQARKTQQDFPHLTVVSDNAHDLSDAAALVHVGASPDGSDADVPTTILVDKQGAVRWIYRSPSVIARLSPDDLLAAIDQHMR
jgi:alkyl hydroperoxide reductase subunit AhpC